MEAITKVQEKMDKCKQMKRERQKIKAGMQKCLSIIVKISK